MAMLGCSGYRSGEGISEEFYTLNWVDSRLRKRKGYYNSASLCGQSR